MALFGYDTAGLASFYDSNKSQVDKASKTAIGAAETIGAAMAFGWLGTRYPDVNLLGLDLGLVAGVALFGLGLMDAVPGYSDHATMLGTGALASYAAAKGASWGADGKKTADAAAKKTTAPTTPAAAPTGATAGVPYYLPPAQPQFSMSPADLARAAMFR